MSHALAFKQDVRVEDPIQTATARISGKASRSNFSYTCSSSERLSATGGFLTAREALPEQVSTTFPSDLEFSYIPIEGRKLRMKQSIYLGSEYFTDGDLLRLENEDLSLFISGNTRTELMHELCIYIGFLWAEYAMEDDDKLDPSGQELKRRLLERFELIK